MTQLLKTGDVAKRLNLSPDKVRDLAKTGVLPTVGISRTLLFREETINEAVQQAERRGNAAKLLPA
jgi:excisionase family DNA binding protein